MNAGAIAWDSGRQTTTALCTAMAETKPLAKVVVKVKYLRAIQFDLQEPTHIDSTIVWVDNTVTLAVANGNDFAHETLKHVTVMYSTKYFFCYLSICIRILPLQISY